MGISDISVYKDDSGLFKKGNPAGCNRYSDADRDRISAMFLDAARKNYTVDQCCVHAWINKKTWYRWLDEDEELSRDYDLAKQGLLSICNDVVFDSIAKDRDPRMAFKVLQAMDDRFRKEKVTNNNTLVMADLWEVLSMIQSKGTSYIDKSSAMDISSLNVKDGE